MDNICVDLNVFFYLKKKYEIIYFVLIIFCSLIVKKVMKEC